MLYGNARISDRPPFDRAYVKARSTLDATILRHLSAALARAERAEKALRVAQSALAMLTEPQAIRTTRVHEAWAVAVDAELQCRRALSASVAEEA